MHYRLHLESGATIKEVQERLSHTNSKTMMTIYTHVTDKKSEETADKFVFLWMVRRQFFNIVFKQKKSLPRKRKALINIVVTTFVKSEIILQRFRL